MAPTHESVLLDRAAGALVGLAVGDALGAPYAFNPPLKSEPLMEGGGGWAPGEFTDDTAMAVCIAESAATGTIDANVVGARFMQWLREGGKGRGMQTSAVVGAAKEPSDLLELSTRYHEHQPDNSAGNGSLMRTAPVALANLGDDQAIVALAREVSALTHADLPGAQHTRDFDDALGLGRDVT